jgi:hypothetical protein
MNRRDKYVYMSNKLSTNCRNKIFVRTERIVRIVGTNSIRIEHILKTIETRNLYIPNKLYELTQQIIKEK